MSKKILSLALAVVMLFSVCSVAAGAVMASGDETIRIYMTSDAKVGATKGTIVKVSYYIDLPDGVDELQMCTGTVAVGYNSAAYKYNSTAARGEDARHWGEDFADYMKSTSAVTYATAFSNNVVKKFNDNDKAKGWDSALQVGMAYNDSLGYGAQTGIAIYDNMHIFTLDFEVQRTLTADDVIGVVEGAYYTPENKSTFFKINYFNGTTTPVTYPVAQIDMDDAVAVAPAEETVKYDVYNLKGYDKTAPADKHSEGNGKNTVAVYFGLGMDPVVNEDTGRTTFITAITATVTVKSNGETITVNTAELDKNGEIKYVYKVGEGYGFRVILQNVPDDADVTVTPSLVYEGDAAYNIETVSFNVADAYARS